MINNQFKIAIIGLGYVGLPLAIEFSKKFQVVAYDLNKKRIDQIKNSIDKNYDKKFNYKNLKKLSVSSNPNILKNANFYIITVPTPVDDFNTPNLNPLINATKLVSKYIKKNDIIVFESTVYPSTTENICKPIIEKKSKLKCSTDFFIGFSPERINPGDETRSLKNVIKIVSGCCEKSLEKIYFVYSKIIKAGLHKAKNIKIAEASKMLENIQRDVNIALINEVTKIFNKLEISTKDVIDAASTKWNFHKYYPGLVGGHCIGVDPYYWIHNSKSPDVSSGLIITARKTNDSMSLFIADKFIKMISKIKKPFSSMNICILGYAFKENCSDTRNTKVKDLIYHIQKYNLKISIFDPLVDFRDQKLDKNIKILSLNDFKDRSDYDALLLSVPHDIILKNLIIKKDEKLFDIKSVTNFANSYL